MTQLAGCPSRPPRDCSHPLYGRAALKIDNYPQYARCLRERLCLERQLADDAEERGWDREVDRHQRIADRIRGLLEVERRDILNSRNLSRLTRLLAEHPELATRPMEHWADRQHGEPLGYITMTQFNHDRLGLPRELPGTGAIARARIDAGAPVNGHPGDKETPLITVASSGDADVARVLTEAGADIEAISAPDSGGAPSSTALGHAAAFPLPDEHKAGNRQLKAYLRGPGKILRSQSPDLVKQEICQCVQHAATFNVLVGGTDSIGGAGAGYSGQHQFTQARPLASAREEGAMFRERLLAAAAAVTLAAWAVALAAEPAHASSASTSAPAASGLLTVPAAATGLVAVACPGSDEVTFSPGLRNFSQSVSFTESLAGHACTGLGKISGDNSFASPFSGTTSLSCTTLHPTGMFTLVLTWSPSGRTSTWSATFGAVAYVNGELVATSTGQITAGDYTGATLTGAAAYPTSQLTACLSAPGLTNLSGTFAWTFAGL